MAACSADDAAALRDMVASSAAFALENSSLVFGRAVAVAATGAGPVFLKAVLR